MAINSQGGLSWTSISEVGWIAKGDVLLADTVFSNYWTIALLLEREVDLVSRRDGKRKMDFCQGWRLGRYDHIVTWQKPKRPSWMSLRLYRRLPETLSIRELKVRHRFEILLKNPSSF